MRWVFVVLMVVHGLIHLMGFAKAFGLAELPQLAQPISRTMGVAWLLAASLVLAATGALFAWPRGGWMIGAAALVLSQVVIVSSWSDAKAGTLANLLLVAAVAYGFATQGPTSFRAAFDAEAERGRARVASLPAPAPITEADLAPLPPPVQRYLRVTGFVGQPRITSYQLRFRGRMRGSPTDPWMPFEAIQQSFADAPTRLFLMDATMTGVPVQSFHRFVGPSATFAVKVAGAVTMVDARGPDMDRAETVTLFNDMCILAPGTLISPSIAWEPIDDRTARARFTNGAHTVEATLHFDAEGQLVDFVSDDRLRSSRDGSSFARQRFSTPLRGYQAYGPVRLARFGEARWHAPAPEGEFAYGEFELLEISYGVR
jgi:hypothetical protein